MPVVEFVTQSSRDPANPQATSERLVNLYPEPLPPGARSRFALKSVPGTTAFATLPGVFVRAFANATEYDESGSPRDRLVAVSDGRLRVIDVGGVASSVATIPDDANTGLSTNGGQITITADGRYFVWTGTALQEPTPGVFNTFGGVEFLGDYTILTEKNDRRFCWSDLTDPLTLPALSFATAEARDDVLIRPVAIAGNLWLFKTGSIEIWGRTGASGADAFAMVGPVIETGLRSFGEVCKIPNGAFFIGSDGVAYLTGGAPQLQPVSPPAIIEAIRRREVSGCFYYEASGHKFCVVRFREHPALCYDLATGVWHERAEGEAEAWGATCAAYAYGAWHFGGFNGAVRVASDTFADNGAALIRRAVSFPVEEGGERFVAHKAVVRGQMGTADIGRVPQVLMRLSRDGGKTWSGWRSTSLGALGDYTRRAVFRSLGQARVLSLELRVTDPAELTLWSSVEVS